MNSVTNKADNIDRIKKTIINYLNMKPSIKQTDCLLNPNSEDGDDHGYAKPI